MTPGMILTSPQLADILHCSPRTIEDHARAGTLPGVKIGDAWIFVSDIILDAVRDLSRAEADSRKAPKPKRDPVVVANTSKTKRIPAGMEHLTEAERNAIFGKVSLAAH
jgi:hypothetical protein